MALHLAPYNPFRMGKGACSVLICCRRRKKRKGRERELVFFMASVNFLLKFNALATQGKKKGKREKTEERKRESYSRTWFRYGTFKKRRNANEETTKEGSQGIRERRRGEGRRAYSTLEAHFSDWQGCSGQWKGKERGERRRDDILYLTRSQH